jgi:hypothetical protein
MPQSATGSATCSECNASYGTVAKLREHQRMAHRGRSIEERPQAAGAVEQSKDYED